MKQAAGIVSMGDYNTFCEILWLDKPALIIPRSIPRLEQTIRANRAAKLGLIAVLDDSHGREEAQKGETDPVRVISPSKRTAHGTFMEEPAR